MSVQTHQRRPCRDDGNFIGRKFKTAWKAGTGNGLKAPGGPQHFPRFFLRKGVIIMTTEANLREEVGQALMTFQLIEEAIRDYLDTTAKIIKKDVKYLKKEFSLYDKKDTLGTLIKKFANVSTNITLVQWLNDNIKKRNDIAHKIWLDFRKETSRLLRGPKDRDIGDKLNACVTNKIKDVTKIEENAHNCLITLLIETMQIKKYPVIMAMRKEKKKDKAV